MSKNITHSVFFILTLLFSLELTLLKADLPVHCLKHQIVGSWDFFLTAAITTDSSERVTCEHESPDSPLTSFLAMSETFHTDTTISLNLQHDDSVKEEGSNSGTSHWTMIYDEGFEVQHRNIRYFAFSEYVQTDSGYKSKCSKTLVGWYHNYATHEKGCFKAAKKDGSNLLTDNTDQAYVVEPDYVQLKDKKLEKIQSFEQEISKEVKIKKKKSISHHEKKNDELINFDEIDLIQHKRFSERLNKNVKKKWVAGVHSKFETLNLFELNSRAGRRKFGKMSPSTESTISSFVEIDRYNSLTPSDVSDLPKSWDWKNYLESPRSQGDCGSCYIFATLAMLQARLKIKNKENVVLSVQHMINCNFYNQGCDGGYPFLVEKFANEYELVEDSCMPYHASNGKCEDSCDVSQLAKTYHVGEYRFIGGSYGKSNEREMMIELKENGPIVVSFEPQYDFMYYDSGIYHSVPAADWIQNGEKKPEWEKVDHSVLCYGWGEEDGEKYWMLQNTWGSDWGEKGFFRMKRGTDESHIESLAEASDPIIKKRSGVFKENRKNKFFLE